LAEPPRPAPRRDTPAETASASQTEVVLEFAQPLSHDEVKLSLETVAAVIQEGLGKPRIELANKEHVSGNKPYETWTLRITRDPQQTKQLLDEFKQQLASKPVFPTSSTIGGQVAARSQQYAVFAIVVSLIAIIIYVWIRFQKVVYGAAAVVALVHDVLVTLGMVAISAYIVEWAGWTSPVLLMEPFKINLPVVAAFLTIIGFSINDTIVIFDRIRDLRGKSPYLTAGVINASVNQMLGRTLLTSMTVITVVTILYIWGGAEIHGFAFAMLVGLVAGVYSTVYVATPIVLWMTKAPEPPRGGPPRPVERTPVEVA
ncbi:MAG: protein translocase subunit SecF, partial [Pirellulales bacterium]